MFILKFFATIILVIFTMIFLFIIFSLFLTKSLIDDVNESLAKKENDKNGNTGNNAEEIPSAIECTQCGTFYAQMPTDRKCSCGAIL